MIPASQTLERETAPAESSEWVEVKPPRLPDISDLVTEDDTPVDNIFSEKEQRLLTETLYTSWPGPGEGRPFLALANVGVYSAVRRPPLVPDVLLSLDVTAAEDLWAKENRCYLLWEFGKPPEVVIEIVSNRKGQEAGTKQRDYARIGVAYYVIFDPTQTLSDEVLRVFELRAGGYVPLPQQPFYYLLSVGLGARLWTGEYEGHRQTWLRWCDQQGVLIPTGAERAEQERQRAEQERQRAERLAAQLRALGVEPEA